MLMLPDELYVTNCRDLDNTNRQLFGQDMYRFEFRRETDRNVASLQIIYKNMLETIQNEGFMMTTKSSVLSLRNSYVDLLCQLTVETDPGKRAEVISQLRTMSKILALLKNKTDVLCDEVDACLDVRKEVNFALGDPAPIDPIKINVGAEIMQMMFKEPALKELSTALQQNSQAAIPPERRTEHLRTLAGLYQDRYPDKLGHIGKQAFVNYIMNSSADHAVETWVLSLEKSDNDLYKQVTAFKAFMNIGFSTTLGRVGNMNYGRDPITGFETIPYKASNTPNVGSKFDNEIEQLAFTFQDYFQNGATTQQVGAIVATLHRQAVEELAAMQGQEDELPNILDTEAAASFKKFLQQIDPTGSAGNITLATMVDPAAVQRLADILNSSPEARIAMCQHNIANKLQQYNNQIDSLSMDLPEMFRGFGGYTGTPWNLHTYHDKINAARAAGVDGRTWALMLTKNVKVKSIAFDPANPVQSLLNNAAVVGNYQAVIDTGAYLRGVDNSTFTDEVLKKQDPSVQAVIYFDKNGTIVKKVPDGVTQPLEVAASTDLMNNVTLYDQAHTVGADIKQGKKAQAIVTIGETTFVRDLFQAVWRLRQLHQEQNITIVVSDQIKEQILAGEDRRNHHERYSEILPHK